MRRSRSALQCRQHGILVLDGSTFLLARKRLMACNHVERWLISLLSRATDLWLAALPDRGTPNAGTEDRR